MAYGSVNVPGDLSGKQDLITGVHGQVVGIGADGKAVARNGGNNPSLLINADFRNPVNRKGQREYTSAGCAIDLWRIETNIKVSVEDGFIRISRTISAGNPSFVQYITNPDKLNGKTVILSILYRSNCSANLGFYINNGAKMKATPVSQDWNIVSLAVNLPEDISFLAVRIPQMFASEPVGSYFDIQAVKLELGGHQTFARQNEDGEWEIIDPPDYDLQYALCSQYSPITGEWVGSQHSNKNLMDNSRFDRKENIINQRGQEEYIGTGYGIDRWCSNKSETVISIGDVGLTVKHGATTGGTWVFYQKVENASSFIGKTLTVSALSAEAVGSSATLIISARNSNDAEIGFKSIVISPGLVSVTYDLIPNNTVYLRVGIYARSGAGADDYIKLLAAKLELGPVQTLAHKEGDTWVLNDPPPNKALELAKCQRYFQKIIIRGSPMQDKAYGWQPNRLHVDLSPSMRITPALVSFGGIIYTESQAIPFDTSDVSMYSGSSPDQLVIMLPSAGVVVSGTLTVSADL